MFTVKTSRKIESKKIFFRFCFVVKVTVLNDDSSPVNMLKISAVVLIPCLTAVLLLLLSYIAYIYWRFLVRITTKNKPLKCLKTESATLGTFDIILYLFSKKLTPKLGYVIPKFGNGHENATSFWPRRFDSGNLKKKVYFWYNFKFLNPTFCTDSQRDLYSAFEWFVFCGEIRQRRILFIQKIVILYILELAYSLLYDGNLCTALTSKIYFVEFKI